MVLVSLIFIILAAVCNAIMDVVQFHYMFSIFYKKHIFWVNRLWWDPTISWLNKYEDRDYTKPLRKILWFDVPFTDAWHTFKTLMVIFIVLSIITFDKSLIKDNTSFIALLILYGTLWNVSFNLTYNNLYKK